MCSATRGARLSLGADSGTTSGRHPARDCCTGRLRRQKIGGSANSIRWSGEEEASARPPPPICCGSIRPSPPIAKAAPPLGATSAAAGASKQHCAARTSVMIAQSADDRPRCFLLQPFFTSCCTARRLALAGMISRRQLATQACLYGPTDRRVEEDIALVLDMMSTALAGGGRCGEQQLEDGNHGCELRLHLCYCSSSDLIPRPAPRSCAGVGVAFCACRMLTAESPPARSRQEEDDTRAGLGRHLEPLMSHSFTLTKFVMRSSAGVRFRGAQFDSPRSAAADHPMMAASPPLLTTGWARRFWLSQTDAARRHCRSDLPIVSSHVLTLMTATNADNSEPFFRAAAADYSPPDFTAPARDFSARRGETAERILPYPVL